MNNLKLKIETLYKDAESTYENLSERYGVSDIIACEFAGRRDAYQNILLLIEAEAKNEE